ncbi:MAG: F0F1 ATP synthase subunit B [Patescibacteria group bacterium]|nr:F0F1 ATP synthase subunit B [Patescibacteria group bacterium]
MIINLPHLAQLVIPVAHAAEEASSGGVMETLGINWKLFLAQIVNFGIILLVLWKWVFIPVAKKLQERTDKIEKSLNDAERIEKEKKEFEAWKNEQMANARKEAGSIITAAQADAGKAKEQILREAKTEQQKIVDQAKQQIEEEKTHALSQAKTEIANMVTVAAEKILRGKLNEKNDQELIKESLAQTK